jgi:lysophospholipase L1-like esterase
MHAAYAYLCRWKLAVALAALTATAHGTPVAYPHAFDPDPARYANAIAAFASADAQAMPPQDAIVCTGSSSMRRWHGRIHADLPGLTVIPRGFGGSQLSDMIWFAQDLILKYQPRAVLLYEGDNDIHHGKSPERIRDDLAHLVAFCRATLPELRFYVISIKPSIARQALWPKAQAANALLREFCANTTGLTFIDITPVMLTPAGEPRADLLVADQLHLNDAGYDLWAGVIAPLLRHHEARFESAPAKACCQP